MDPQITLISTDYNRLPDCVLAAQRVSETRRVKLAKSAALSASLNKKPRSESFNWGYYA